MYVFVSPSVPELWWNYFVGVCVCATTRDLWSGCFCRMARVTSSCLQPVGMWWVWLRPTHKLLHPGTITLPLQTRKQRPRGKPHRQPATSGEARGFFSSRMLLLFQSHTQGFTADPRVKTFSCWLLWCSVIVSVTSFTSPDTHTEKEMMLSLMKAHLLSAVILFGCECINVSCDKVFITVL